MRFTSASIAVVTALVTPDLLADQAGNSTITLGEVNITQKAGVALSTENVLTSVDVMGGDQVEDKNVMNSWQLLGQMPGIQLTETGQGAESGKATFRAFNGEGYVNGIKTLIDGVPSNVNSGNQRFIDMIFPLEIDYIEVVRGTNDPRYGLHNIGGNINFATRQGGNYADSRLTYGSFNTREVQIALGHEEGNFAQNYMLAKQDTNGSRDHSNSNKYSLGGKWFLSNDEQNFRVGAIARLYHQQADEGGFLTREELHASRTDSPAKNDNDRSDRDMKQLSLHMDWQLRDDLNLSSKLYYNSYNDDRSITFTSYEPGNGPRQRRFWDEQQRGMLSNLTWRVNDMLTLDGGINYEEQHNAYERRRFNFSVPTNFDGPPARVQNDDHYTLRNLGGYVQAVIQPIDSLKIIPAMRVDKFSGNTNISSTNNGVTTSAKGPLQDYGWIEQPKLSVVYSVNDDIDVYANWGRTFQVLTGNANPAYLVNGAGTYDPSINTGKEVGVKFRPFEGTEARVAVWQQDATDEVANMPAIDSTVGLGETRRRGIDMQFTSRLNDQWTVWGSHAIQEAKVMKGNDANNNSLKGKEVFSTPRYISNLGAEYRMNDDWRFGMQARAQGDYYIDANNEAGKYGGFAVLDASVSYRISVSTSVDLQVKNLTDREYEYVWYDNFWWPAGEEQPMFSPAPGRSAFVSLNMKL
ncbi:TonB-dependent receptor [Pseudomonas sp. FYR_2]|uniref:TonB-dependent receptor n=1 Tax=unclassified Pseudomonas TaxID=196821 RepID=UPI00370AFD63